VQGIVHHWHSIWEEGFLSFSVQRTTTKNTSEALAIREKELAREHPTVIAAEVRLVTADGKND
jgi:hypothetical protein